MPYVPTEDARTPQHRAHDAHERGDRMLVVEIAVLWRQGAIGIGTTAHRTSRPPGHAVHGPLVGVYVLCRTAGT